MSCDIFGPSYPDGLCPDINVTQYGWSDYESGGAILIQDYLAQAEKYRDECAAILEGIQNAVDGVPDIESYYVYIKSAYDDFRAKFPAFETDYASFLEQYNTIQQQVGFIDAAYKEFQQGKDFIDAKVQIVNAAMVEINKNLAEIGKHMTEIRTMVAQAESYRDECAEYAEEVREGKVFRGLWDPEASKAYPAPVPTTNSYWDIILASGASEFEWNSITWKAGNSLVYTLAGSSWSQAVNLAAGVQSFNGRNGVVKPMAGDYTAEMVGAEVKGDAERIADLAVEKFRNEENPLPKYPLISKLGTHAVTSFNGRKGSVFGEEAWAVKEAVGPTTLSLANIDGRVMVVVDTRRGIVDMTLTDRLTELYIKDVGGKCSEYNAVVNKSTAHTINGNDSEEIDVDFGYVHYKLMGDHFVTIGGA